ncbi:hypothetical protein MTBUT4_270020 [Magnetospirillum sp. UT-4]|nr:hypothetical protein MTBUT4_270020 [Magnetospirillum sp. UT-4]
MSMNAWFLFPVNSYLEPMNNDFFGTQPFSVNLPLYGRVYTPMVCCIKGGSFCALPRQGDERAAKRAIRPLTSCGPHEFVADWQVDATYGI